MPQTRREAAAKFFEIFDVHSFDSFSVFQLAAMPQVRFSKDGSKWDDGSSIKWSPEPELVKLVIGDDPSAKDDKRIRLVSGNLPANFAELYPKLTHLHLWGIAGLTRLPKLPEGLLCLDVRGCSDLALLTNLPEGLEELLIESASQDLKQLPDTKGGLKELRELSFNNCRGMDEESFDDSIVISPDSKLQRLILSGTSITDLNGLQFSTTEQFGWPGGLVDLRLSDMEKLVALAPSWPVALRRLEIKNVTGLSSLPNFPDTLDYIDLQGLRGVERLPRIPASARTLFIHGASLNLPGVLYGEENENKVKDVRGEQQSKEFGVEYDHEVKVILLGNGRCGKTSLAKAIIGKEPFKKDESSTHGIKLWPLELPFIPLDSAGNDDAANQKEAKASLNIWDFAGQDLYHNTHRLFFQVKAVFVICVTDHGKGWDQASDEIESQAATQFDEEDRESDYWEDQVRSLMNRPGANEPPPIIVVKTKVDRDMPKQEGRSIRGKEDGDRTEVIRFSAATKEGVEDLKRRLSLDIAKVLGTKQERQIGVQRKKVKDLLQQRKDAFQVSKTDGKQRRGDATNNKAYIRRSEFDEMVRSNSKSPQDQEDPGVFLDRLHKSGFLFYSKEFAKDYVILDQRWVIDGIYTLFDRKKGWPFLKISKGNFTLSDLNNWAWGGYPSSTQQLFLNFMQECGICFQTLTASESERGEPVYTAPAAWPEEAKIASKAANFRNNALPNGGPVVLRNQFLGRDAVTQLIVKLGRKWRRAPIYWRWGGQFRSYRKSESALTRTFVHINWVPDSAKSFGGRIELQLYGPDASFLQAIIKEMRDEPPLGFEMIKTDLRSVNSQLEVDLAKQRFETAELESDLAKPEGKEGLAVHEPSPVIAKSITISISYAGDGQDPGKPWRSFSTDSIERWPRALSEALENKEFHVEQYRLQQTLDRHETEAERKDYLDKVANTEFMVAFLSKKYLQSNFCMYELSQVYKSFHEGKLKHERLRVVRFDNGSGKLVSGRQKLSDLHLTLTEFADHWKERLAVFISDITADAESFVGSNPIHLNQLIKTDATAEWYLFVNNSEKLLLFCRNLMNWPVDDVNVEPAEEYLQKLVGEIGRNLGRSEVLIDYAIRVMNKGDDERATDLFLEALKLAPNYDESQLLSRLREMSQDKDLNRLRKFAYFRLSQTGSENSK